MEESMDKYDWLSLDEVAKLLGVSKDTVYGLAKSSKLPGYKIGRRWRFLRSDFTVWLHTKSNQRSEIFTRTDRGSEGSLENLQAIEERGSSND